MEREWARRINYLGAIVGGARHLIDLEPEALIECARNTTGLSEFPRDRYALIESGLRHLLQGEQALHLVGRLLTRSELLRALRNQLLIADMLQRRSKVAAEKIEQPIVISGHPRSGTTILYELMALDPQLRAPLAWEVASPVPPRARMLGGDISLAEIAQCENELWADLAPEINAIHELRWDLPAECYQILYGSLARIWSAAPDYATWQRNAQADHAYAWHKTVLQVLQHGRIPRRWLLKAPVHLHFLDHLVRVYPDAKVVLTHRDPVKTVPSAASFRWYLNSLRFAGGDRQVLARGILMLLEGATRKVMEERDTGVLAPAQVVDVPFGELMRRPVAMMRALYEQLGLAFSEDFANKIALYLAHKPRHKFGRHNYRAADFGLREEEIRERFAFYTKRHALARED